ncbi:hypothetical protein ACJQWK_00015 [Exserohilum turcicum]
MGASPNRTGASRHLSTTTRRRWFEASIAEPSHGYGDPERTWGLGPGPLRLRFNVAFWRSSTNTLSLAGQDRRNLLPNAPKTYMPARQTSLTNSAVERIVMSQTKHSDTHCSLA